LVLAEAFAAYGIRAAPYVRQQSRAGACPASGPARDRVASVLIAVFAQPVSRVARLTVDDVTVDGENVAIRFGDTAVSVPEPVASDVRKLLADSPSCRPGSSGDISGCSPAPWRRARSASWSSAVA
jgi:hypothetical protein